MHRLLFSVLLSCSVLQAGAQIKIDVPGLASPAAGDSVLDTNRNSKVIACNGNAVWIRGNNNHLNVAGDCKAVHVLGNGNQVAIEKTATLSTEGNKNTVTYRNEDAKANNPGTGNRVTRLR